MVSTADTAQNATCSYPNEGDCSRWPHASGLRRKAVPAASLGLHEKCHRPGRSRAPAAGSAPPAPTSQGAAHLEELILETMEYTALFMDRTELLRRELLERLP